MTQTNQSAQEAIISLGPDTMENRQFITQDIAAAMRWYATSNARYADDEQSLYRLGQMLEHVHGIR